MTDLPLPSFSVSTAGRQNWNHSVCLAFSEPVFVLDKVDILISVTAVTGWLVGSPQKTWMVKPLQIKKIAAKLLGCWI